MNTHIRPAFGSAVLCLALSVAASASERFVDVSPKHPRYFAESSGRTWIPIGCNICFDRLFDGKKHSHAAVRANFDRWFRAFAANGGNCARLWLGHRSLEVMPDTSGVYDPVRTETVKGVVRLAEELGIRIKFTLESFRTVNPAGTDIFNRPLYAPYAKNMKDFIASEECYRIYLGKAEYLKRLGFGDSPAVYCWELWNEINSIGSLSVYAPWSDRALADLKRMFPKQMVVQNLGSYSDLAAYQLYDQLATVKDNGFMQIHRYLDDGACLDVCRGPMDVVASSATREMLDRRLDLPAIVAEIGAVKPNHTGPSPFYGMDRDGSLLHDEIFAPFFSGTAGSGQPWHWDHQYLDGNRLWWHFGRFAKAIAGFDPAAEHARPFYTESRRLRMYGLKGRTTAILWCRDKRNTWEDEFVKGTPPELLKTEKVPFRNCSLDCYDPWTDTRTAVPAPTLPAFRRSIVVRVPADAVEGIVRQH